MKWFVYKYFFVRKGDRVPFLVFLSMLVAVGLLRWYFYEHPIKSDEPAAPEIVESEYASFLKKAKADEEARAARFERGGAERRVETFPFDPNRADSATFVRLGLAPWQVRNIYKYRARGGRYHRPEDFAKLYGLTKGDYDRLRPYIRIADEFRLVSDLYPHGMPKRDSLAVRPRQEKLAAGMQVDLNAADTSMLKKVPGIGSYRARQIVNYRERLGGFVAVEQLAEVEGLPDTLRHWFTVAPAATQQLYVNRMSVNELRRHP